MRVSRAKKQERHELIIEEAARLIREGGLPALTVSEVMAAAGMTHGGFYKHFEDREALLLAALDTAFAQRESELMRRYAGLAPAEVMRAYVDDYLADEHISDPADGCPVPVVTGDVGRAPTRLKERYGRNLRRVIDGIAQGMPGDGEAKRFAGARAVALLAGAVMLARASDEDTARLVLSASRQEFQAPGSNPSLSD